MRHLLAFAAALLLGLGAAFAAPLDDAVRSGNLDQVKQALDGGAGIAEPDEAGDPPLIIAALAGNPDIVILLLQRGADVGIRNKHGLTALHAASYAGNLEIVKLLVAKGAAVNDTHNFYKMTPLHAAAEEDHADVVAFLLVNGADIEAKERNGYTPLSQAGWRGYWDAAGLLMKAGAVCQGPDIVGERFYRECLKRK
jgi:ankyrin repeat protein